MKCTIPEISWHNREPVLSVDFHPVINDFYRLATGGGDCHVLIWQMTIEDNGVVKHDVISDLTRHQKSVNAVRWSPSGQYLASADDDAYIIVWFLKTDNVPSLEIENNEKEIWLVHKILRGHKEDVYDLSWSPDSSKLLSGSIDNTAILWNIDKGRQEEILTDHKGFVQGVAWDPKNQFIATISTDRICRLYNNNGKQIVKRIHKGTLPVKEGHYLHKKEVKYFHDDTFKSFFRRLHFSPDGSLLLIPSGQLTTDDCKEIMNVSYIFTMDSIDMPAALIPLPKQSSTVIKCCPVYYELHEDGPEPCIDLPYRMIFAVGADHDVILYDTQQLCPFATLHDVHYTRLTDLTWSSDGLILVASSTDGFCSLITFEPNELGMHYTKEESETEDSVLNVSGCDLLDDSVSEQSEKQLKDSSSKDTSLKDPSSKDTSLKEHVQPVRQKKPNILELWTIKTPKKAKLVVDESKAAQNGQHGEQSGTERTTSIDTEMKKITVGKKNSEPKLIAVRKTPNIYTLNPQTSSNVKSIIPATDKSAPKLIAIRRKPRDNLPPSITTTKET